MGVLPLASRASGQGDCSASAGGVERHLILMRHAESEDSRQLQDLRDHDRPITAQGRAAARQVARAMREGGWIPDVVICSNALRSKQTLEAMGEELPELEDADAHFLGSLYTISQLDGQTRAHLQTIVETEARSQHACVLCLGHNKGWEEAASSFVNQHVKLGNCSAAVLSGIGQDWNEAFGSEAEWRLITVLTPN